MSDPNRRSFYFSEENQDLKAFLQTKKKRANAWVMDAIRQAMVTELNGGVVHPATPSQNSVDYQALMQRILLLESQAKQAPQSQVPVIEQPAAPVAVEPVAPAPVMPEPVLEPMVPEVEPAIQPQSTMARPVVKNNYQINKPQPTIHKPQPKQPAGEFDALGNIGFS